MENQTYEKYLLNQTNFDLTLPEERKAQAKLAVKDEYTFDFAELSPKYSKYELEKQLVNHVQELKCVGGYVWSEIVDIFPQTDEGIRRISCPLVSC